MLKILIVIESNSWQDWHLAASLEDMGHQVYRYYYGDSFCYFYGRKKHNQRVDKNKQLVAAAKKLYKENKLDMIFCCALSDDFLLPSYASELEKLDVPFVNYNIDMATQWYRFVHTAKYFNYMLCAQPTNMDNLSRYAKKVLYFPMAAKKTDLMHMGYSDFTPKTSVTFLGTPTDYRIKMLSFLHNESIPLSVYGKYWNDKNIAAPFRNVEKTVHDIWNYGLVRLRGEGMHALVDAFARRFSNNIKMSNSYVSDEIIQAFVPTDDINHLFRKSKINIGFTRILGDDPYRKGMLQMRLRDFEVPYSGGFYLVEAAPGYDELFRSNEEVVLWNTPGELKDKIFYYLKNEKEREEIAKLGQQRALREHTWDHRFNSLFRELGLIAKA